MTAVHFMDPCKVRLTGEIELIGTRPNGSRQHMALEGEKTDEWLVQWTGETFLVWRRRWERIG